MYRKNLIFVLIMTALLAACSLTPPPLPMPEGEYRPVNRTDAEKENMP